MDKEAGGTRGLKGGQFGGGEARVLVEGLVEECFLAGGVIEDVTSFTRLLKPFRAV